MFKRICTVGDKTGIERFEMFVDAKDLQKRNNDRFRI